MGKKLFKAKTFYIHYEDLKCHGYELIKIEKDLFYVRCLMCGNTMSDSKRKFIRSDSKSRNCKKCRDDEFYFKKNEEFKNKNKDFEIIGYVASDKKSDFLYNIKHKCGHVWFDNWSNIRSKPNCQVCGKITNPNKDILNLKLIKLKKKFTINSDVINMDDLNVSCGRCNHTFNASWKSILAREGCPKCNMSKAEFITHDFLSSNNIINESEYSFNDCKSMKLLRFDFYLRDYNICIELDGRQHFEPIDIFGGIQRYEATKENDKIKTDYCKNKHGMRLIRIPYWDFDKIEEILKRELDI